MADLFTTVVTSPLAKRAGVPQPTRLRRFTPGDPLVEGPVLVAGGGRFEKSVLAHLERAGISVVSTVDDTSDRLGAIIMDLSAALDPTDLAQLRILGAPAVKRLAKNARVVIVGTDPATLTDVAEVTTQRAIEGFSRSLAKGLRLGATANLVLAHGEAHDGVVSAVDFLLSGRSAYVDGQVVRVSEATGTNPDPLEPLAGMSPAERVETVKLLRSIAQGRTLIIIDHDMDSLFELVERVTVLQEGRILAEGTPEEIKNNAAVQQAYLGGMHAVGQP